MVIIISLSKVNLPLIGAFTWPTPPGPYRATTCRGWELNYGSYTYFFDHTRTWRASPDEWSAQCRGHLRDSTNMKDNTHQAHTHSSQQGECGMMMTTVKWYSGTLGGGLKFPDICLTGEEKPRKKPHPGNLSRPGIESGPAAWQARMLPLAPQRWTNNSNNNNSNNNVGLCIFEVLGRVNISGHWRCNEWWLMIIMMATWYSGTLGA